MVTINQARESVVGERLMSGAHQGCEKKWN